MNKQVYLVKPRLLLLNLFVLPIKRESHECASPIPQAHFCQPPANSSLSLIKVGRVYIEE